MYIFNVWLIHTFQLLPQSFLFICILRFPCYIVTLKIKVCIIANGASTYYVIDLLRGWGSWNSDFKWHGARVFAERYQILKYVKKWNVKWRHEYRHLQLDSLQCTKTEMFLLLKYNQNRWKISWIDKLWLATFNKSIFAFCFPLLTI